MVSSPFQWILQPRHNLQPPAKAYIHMHAPTLLLAHSAKHAKEHPYKKTIMKTEKKMRRGKERIQGLICVINANVYQESLFLMMLYYLLTKHQLFNLPSPSKPHSSHGRQLFHTQTTTTTLFMKFNNFFIGITNHGNCITRGYIFF